MGVSASTEGKIQASENTRINRELEKDHIRDATTIKMLLLGAAECGKSTVLKQMRFLHANGYSDSDIDKKKYIIYSNTVTSMGTLVKAMKTFGFQYEHCDQRNNAQLVLETIESKQDECRFSKTLYEAIKMLWSDDGVQMCWTRRSEIQINDSAKYFLDAIDRIYAIDYKPTTDDILHMRVPTTGVLETMFKINGASFRVFDVGGQRSERRKWIHCFDNVNSVVFIIAVSEFDQVLLEDMSTNRLKEAMALYHTVLNSRWFKNASMILFLNKTDLFNDKLNSGKSINIVFPNYSGDNSYTSSLTYINDHLRGLNNTEKTIYTHETCATDSNQVAKVLICVIDTVISLNLNNAGVM